jgi:hypothetical protein
MLGGAVARFIVSLSFSALLFFCALAFGEGHSEPSSPLLERLEHFSIPGRAKFTHYQ